MLALLIPKPIRQSLYQQQDYQCLELIHVDVIIAILVIYVVY